MTLKCPACFSTRVRQSHWRRGDPSGRMLFFAAYRCRDCHQRFFRLASWPFVGIGVVVLAILAVGIGMAVGESHLEADQRMVPVETAAALGPAEITSATGLPQSPARETMATLAALADQGDAKAQFQLGMSYRSGEEGSRDYPLAFKWVEASAQQGYAEAQYALGMMYLGGDGVLQSFPAAYKWFERAAHQNHAEAQFNLGRMYRRGYGVTASNGQAYMWFNLAAAQGHQRAREARDNILTLLNAEEIRKAQQAAQDWRPEAPTN